jgi:hypothetical protein
MTRLVDPPVPPAADGKERMKAKDLKNTPLILRVVKIDTEPKGNKGPWEYAECEVWTLDRQGVVENATGVRFAWWRALEQLRSQVGQFVACRPVEQDNNSIILAPLEGAAREVAEKVLATVAASVQQAPAEQEPDFDPEGQFSEEPF